MIDHRGVTGLFAVRGHNDADALVLFDAQILPNCMVEFAVTISYPKFCYSGVGTAYMQGLAGILRVRARRLGVDVCFNTLRYFIDNATTDGERNGFILDSDWPSNRGNYEKASSVE